LGASIFPFPDSSEVCIDFDGGTAEELANFTGLNIGIGNAWTIAMWLKTETFDSSAPDTIFELAPNSGSNNRIQIRATTAGAFRIELNSVAVFKDYVWSSLLTLSEAAWEFIVITWNGTNLLLYKNSTLTVETARDTDDAGSMSSNDRRVSVGGWAFPTPTRSFDGRIFAPAIWSVVLDQTAIDTLYNGGAGKKVDYSRDHGLDYADSANLQHWWRIGHDSGDIGKDSGNGTNIDLDVDSTGITGGDIITDAPS